MRIKKNQTIEKLLAFVKELMDAKHTNEEIAKLLEEKSTSVDFNLNMTDDQKGNTLVMQAMKKAFLRPEYYKLVGVLILVPAVQSNLNQITNQGGKTALELAIEFNDEKIIELLDNTMNNPLNEAINLLDLQEVKKIVQEKPNYINKKDLNEEIPLHLALCHQVLLMSCNVSKFGVIQKVVPQGVEYELIPPEQMKSSENKALKDSSDQFINNAREIPALLIENGAILDKKNTHELTPVHFIKKQYSNIVVEAIIKYISKGEDDEDQCKRYNEKLIELERAKIGTPSREVLLKEVEGNEQALDTWDPVGGIEQSIAQLKQWHQQQIKGPEEVEELNANLSQLQVKDILEASASQKGVGSIAQESQDQKVPSLLGQDASSEG
ncbi:hypothetical protein [Candidatus Tisiphia endosymbiont of Nemotelus uliginosus]|uniref:hypothetical protein n=1 Tax=Candidatus Tisiphia endosymbiont of Nemotelus uliginosus TaxID=3077926 RepID=UPI0035C92FCC